MSNSPLKDLFKKQMTRKEFLGIGALAVASLFGVAGIIRMLRSHAASPFIAAEPEAGTLAAGATVVTDTTASGGKSIKFNAPTPTPPSPTPTPPPSGKVRSWKAGYCSGSNTQAGHAAYSSAHGFPIQVYGTYDDSYTSWSQAEAGYNGWLIPIRLNPQDSNHITVIASGLFPNAGSSLSGAAAGNDVGNWQAIGQQLANGGWNNPYTVIRIGHEMNGTWYPWSTGGDATKGGQFAAAFRHAVDGIRAHAPNVKFDICFNCASGGSTVISSHYPGDSYVDIIGIDIYDGNATGHAATSYAGYLSAQGSVSIQAIADFANAHGKQIAVDEWGMNGSQSTHDNPNFVQYLFTQLSTLNNTTYPGIVSHDTIFDNTTKGTNGWAPNPNAAAKYKLLWTT